MSLSQTHPLEGVYAASVTPLLPDFSPDLETFPQYLRFLADRGCHGALLLGTTGEGPSFSPEERCNIFKSGLLVRQTHPDFKLLAGTGTPSMDETIGLTKSAFDMGFDGVVVLPPYYYRNVSDDGLFDWFSQVLDKSVPSDGCFLGYHIPAISGIGISFKLIEKLMNAFPKRFCGLKDSSHDLKHAQRLGKQFGNDLLILNGNDGLFTSALHANAKGCITALANLCSPDLRLVWQAHQQGDTNIAAQSRLKTTRQVMSNYPPAAPLVKAILNKRFNFPLWPVHPPLLPLSPNIVEKANLEMDLVRDVRKP